MQTSLIHITTADSHAVWSHAYTMSCMSVFQVTIVLVLLTLIASSVELTDMNFSVIAKLLVIDRFSPIEHPGLHENCNKMHFQ